jgi:hypothetical protein
MSTHDYIELRNPVIHLGAHHIARPCKREEAVHETLVLLPDSAPRELRTYARVMHACARLTAVEQAKTAAEKELSAATAELRAEIAGLWKKSEIPKEVISVLTVW